MNGKQRFEEQGFKLTLSSEFSDIFERLSIGGEKTVVVFDKKSFQILLQNTIDGQEICSFMADDIFLAISKHCEDLGW
jgi:hypothetical protein